MKDLTIGILAIIGILVLACVLWVVIDAVIHIIKIKLICRDIRKLRKQCEEMAKYFNNQQP